MHMKLYGKIFFSTILGTVITLVSSMITGTGGGIGARTAGYPFPWMTQPVYPGAPITINYIGLVLDIIIWTVIILAFVQLYSHFEKKDEV